MATIYNTVEQYLESDLITYLGNKRKLIGYIEDTILGVSKELNKHKLTIL